MPHASGELREDVLQGILSVARVLGGSADLTEILSLVIDAMRDTLDAERASVFEYDAAADELFTTVAHGIDAPTGEDDETVGEIRFPTSAGLAGECARSRDIINVSDAYADERFNRAIDRQTGFRTRSILTVPLLGHDGELIGVAQVLNKRDRPFDGDDEEIARALAAQAAVAMKRGRLIEDRLVRQKLERDLELAQTIQQSSFPTSLPTIPGFDVHAWSEPAEETGGDAYDIIAVPSEGDPPDAPHRRALVLMADATGHGVGPALSVTQLRSMFRMAARLGGDLPVVIDHLNRQLSEDLPIGRFITAWLGIIDGREGVIHGVSAGQAPLLRYRAADDAFDIYEADMPPFGVVEDMEIESTLPIRMARGDIYALLSDGFFEAMSNDETWLGSEPLEKAIRAAREGTAEEILDELRRTVDRFAGGRPADDDRTAVVIKATGG